MQVVVRGCHYFFETRIFGWDGLDALNPLMLPRFTELVKGFMGCPVSTPILVN